MKRCILLNCSTFCILFLVGDCLGSLFFEFDCNPCSFELSIYGIIQSEKKKTIRVNSLVGILSTSCMFYV